MAKHFGVDSPAPGQAFGSNDIKAAMKVQKITVNEGDIVLFHTGYTGQKLEADPKRGAVRFWDYHRGKRYSSLV